MNYNKKNQIIYGIIFYLLLTARNIVENLNINFNNLNKLLGYLFVIAMFILLIMWINNIKNKKISITDIFLLLSVGIIEYLGLVSHDIDLIIMPFVIIITYFMNIDRIISCYCISLISVLIIYIVLVRVNIFVTTNKNTIGYFVLILTMFLLFKMKEKKNIKYLLLKTLIVVLGIIGEIFIKDRTAEGLIILLVIMQSLNILQLSKKRAFLLLRSAIILLPFILTGISVYLAINFGKNIEIINRLNMLLSYRIAIWNNLWNAYSVQFFPQDISNYAYTFLNYAGLYVKATDGFFAIGPLKFGWILYLFFIFLMSSAMFKFYKTNDNNSYFFYFLIILILYNFTETIIDRSCFCLILPIVFAYLRKREGA